VFSVFAYNDSVVDESLMLESLDAAKPLRVYFQLSVIVSFVSSSFGWFIVKLIAL